MDKVTKVAAGIWIEGNRLHCFQRKNHHLPYVAFKYEFPGGKIEPGETAKEAVIREFYEELAIKINCASFFGRFEHNYPGFIIQMETYWVEKISGDMVLNDHESHQLVAISDIHKLDWLEADIPIIDRLQKLFL